MRTTDLAPAPRLSRMAARTGVSRWFIDGALAALGAFALLLLLTVAPERIGGQTIVVATGAVVALALLVNPRVDLSLLAVLIYLGCLDGPLKLTSGSDGATLGRDVLLAAAVAGIYLRATVTGTRLPRLPYAGLLALLALVVVAMMFHPQTPGLRGGLVGLRQQLEFAPLIVLIVVIAQQRDVLPLLGATLVVVAVANTLVAAVQFNLAPDQLAEWGPGYRELVLGDGDFMGAARTFGSNGEARVRPLGLGGDSGTSGVYGWVLLPFAMAWMATGRGRLRLLGAGMFGVGVVGILLAQSRGVVVAGALAALAFFALQARSRNAVRTVIGLGAALVLTLGVISVFQSQSRDDSLERLESVTPGQVRDTTVEDRGESIALGLEYAADYPFGVGLGRAGPGSGAVGDPNGLNSETEFNFLIGEIGTVGLLVFMALWLKVVFDAIRLARRDGPATDRALYSAVGAVLIGLTLTWFQGAPTNTTPTAPIFWCLMAVVWSAIQHAGRPAGTTVP